MPIDDKDRPGAVDKVVAHLKKLGLDSDVHKALTPAWDGKTNRRKDTDSVDSFFETMEKDLASK